MAENVQGDVESLDALTGGATVRRHFHQEAVVFIADCSSVILKGNKAQDAHF
jgi:hypothetical protein